LSTLNDTKFHFLWPEKFFWIIDKSERKFKKYWRFF
jgi:hypothetical protein